MIKLPEKIIDFHVHLFPDRFFDAIWKRFISDYGWDVLYHFYYRECVDHLRKNGIGTIAYSNYAHRKGMAKYLNEWNVKVLDEMPDLYCFAAYHPEDEDGPDMAAAIVKHPKILGFKLQLLVQCFYPHDERLYPLYDILMESGKCLLIHVGTGPVGNEFTGINHFKKLLKQYPDMRIIVPHMGALEYDEFGALLDDYPNIYLDTAYSFIPQIKDGFLSSSLGIEFLEKYQDRILYGSDFPNLIFPREVEIEKLLSLNLSQSFYDKVLWKNGWGIIASH
jgi:predicted TIM-barrel fold metal-dependent hydrolase